jgi:radical SAM protein with 4Fe4S-binding SPASM domain
MRYKQESPFAVQIEFVEGCNLYCSMCALTGIREKRVKNYKFMTEDTLRSLVTQMLKAGWNPRIEAAVHGEPSLHPKRNDMVRIIRELAPKYHLMMTSNGGGFLQKPGPLENVRAIFDAGLNMLALDDYEEIGLVPKIREAVKDKLDGVNCYEYPADPLGNPHRRRHISERVLTFIQDINIADKGVHSSINNHAGVGGPPLKKSLMARCAKPFRELTVRWNGDVAVCCNDFRGTYKCGNVVADGLDEVWNGAPMQAARRALYHSRRDLLSPCDVCDAKSYRVGLLPDKMGKVKLPRPSARDVETMRQAASGAPYTAPVMRPWEEKDADSGESVSRKQGRALRGEATDSEEVAR